MVQVAHCMGCLAERLKSIPYSLSPVLQGQVSLEEGGLFSNLQRVGMG